VALRGFPFVFHGLLTTATMMGRASTEN
jgi:hypothetical protein